MKISFVIPAFNEEKLIDGSLRRIRESAAVLAKRGYELEFVVCDNNSSDRTAEIAREHGAVVAFEPINQISRARNRGATAASGEWIIFVDADSHPTTRLLERVAECIESGRYVAGGALVAMESRDWRVKFFTGLWGLLSRIMRWCAGSFIFCETRAFRELGGFSTELFAAEEIEFSKRLKSYARKQGKRTIIISDASVISSDRKLHLYGAMAHARIILKTLFRPYHTLRNRDACELWYDGRR